MSDKLTRDEERWMEEIQPDFATRLALTSDIQRTIAGFAKTWDDAMREVFDRACLSFTDLIAREALWSLAAETRVGVAELATMLGRPKSWVYRATSEKRIPHRKMDGELVFVVGEIREWLNENEEKIV